MSARRGFMVGLAVGVLATLALLFIWAPEYE